MIFFNLVHPGKKITVPTLGTIGELVHACNRTWEIVVRELGYSVLAYSCEHHLHSESDTRLCCMRACLKQTYRSNSKTNLTPSHTHKPWEATSNAAMPLVPQTAAWDVSVSQTYHDDGFSVA